MSCNHRMYEADSRINSEQEEPLLYVKECLEEMLEMFEWQEEYHLVTFVVDNNWPTQLWCRHHCDLLAGPRLGKDIHFTTEKRGSVQGGDVGIS